MDDGFIHGNRFLIKESFFEEKIFNAFFNYIFKYLLNYLILSDFRRKTATYPAGY